MYIAIFGIDLGKRLAAQKIPPTTPLATAYLGMIWIRRSCIRSTRLENLWCQTNANQSRQG